MKLAVSFEEQTEVISSGFAEQNETISGHMQESNQELRVGFKGLQTVSSAGDYSKLKNKPAINEHQLMDGENTLVSIGIGKTTNTAVERLFR